MGRALSSPAEPGVSRHPFSVSVVRSPLCGQTCRFRWVQGIPNDQHTPSPVGAPTDLDWLVGQDACLGNVPLC